MFALLGLAGSTTAGLAGLGDGWVMLVLLGVSAVLLGYSFYSIYVWGNGTTANKIITWLAALLAVGFWTWQLV